MAHRSDDDDVELVRSGSSPLVDEDTLEKKVSLVYNENETGGEDVGDELSAADNGDEEAILPQCKIKRNYSCNLCPFFSQNPRSFLYHSRDVHFDRIKIFECSYCLYASKHSQKLQRHINMIHVAGKNRLKRGVRLTTKDLRPIRPKPLPPQNYILTEGSLMPDEQEPSQIEDESEMEEIVDGEYKCSLCNFKNKSQKLMRRHERIVHLKKRFLRCSKCSYMTHVKARYTKHVKYHSMPMIKCDLCDFRTPYKWNLDRHYKNHCGSGAFQCSKCNFRADIKQSLTVHEMNHHVPPVGQGAVTARKKNKVGSSESPSTEIEKSENVMEVNEDSESRDSQKADTKEEEKREKRTGVQSSNNLKSTHGNKRETTGNSHLQGDFIHPDDIVPRYGQIFVKNLKCKFCSYKAVFSHEIWRHEKRIHGYIRPENKKENAPKRPPPKLIPIQSKTGPLGSVSSAILKIPEVKSKSGVLFPDQSPSPDKSVNENEFNEMCKKSSLTSSLKDFVSLIGDEEGLKTIPDSSQEEDLPKESSVSKTETLEDAEAKDEDLTKEKQMDLMKKKNASFFDKLKEKLLTSSNEEQSLFCEECAHESKCLSEAVAHQKRHSNANNKSEVDDDSESDVVVLGVKLSSTRCQHCRQRCKTSTDLFIHLKSCKAFGTAKELSAPTSLDEYVHREIKREPDLSDKEEENENSMENRVFVWNDLGPTPDEGKGEEGDNDGDEDGEERMVVDIPPKEEREERTVVDIPSNEDEEERMVVDIPLKEDGEEGTVVDIPSKEDGGERTVVDTPSKEDGGERTVVDTPSKEDVRTDSHSISGTAIDKEKDEILIPASNHRLKSPIKNVFKCPHCSFWASTASRFHVHIVGHLNKKPFECSLCMYRSNWRWDITKHIRLKSARDPSHLDARVNMTDETGRRNYSKYSKYLTLMKVHAPSAESSGTGKRSGRPMDITQGNISDKNVVTLPALPRLTGAPMPGTSNQVPGALPSRPPPPLTAAHQISSNSLVDDECEELEDYNKAAKKTLFKCKRCDYRDTDKYSVLSHVKHHYGKKKKNVSRAKFTFSEQFSDESNQSQDTLTFIQEEETSGGKLSSKISFKEISYKCGHCHQASPWKHVIQRHCRLKHNGNALIEVGWRHEEVAPSGNRANIPSDTVPEDGAVKLFLCDICPFTTDSEGNLTAHKLNHIDRPGSIFKCTYCPFYVPSKIAVLEHMQLHGVFGSRFKIPTSNSDDLDDEDSDDDLSDESQPDTSSQQFNCKQCPYVSNVKTQFLYHKQLHIPRNTPYKCKYCSYNVTRPHLLREHLKIHSIVVTTESSDEIAEDSIEKITAEIDFRLKAIHEIDQGALKEIPLVWVLRAGIWKKMYKCRHCPHMNARKNNIQEHERMHLGYEKKNVGDSQKEGSQKASTELQCAHCNYSCSNPGVLASHIKVHKKSYGLVACLVDRERSDAEQVEELEMRVDIKRRTLVAENGETESETKELQQMDKNMEDDHLSSQPENASKETTNNEKDDTDEEKEKKILSFCEKCPARFFSDKELTIHSRFHGIHLPFQCVYCTYTARQRPHLLDHYEVHSQEYKEKTDELVTNYDVSEDWPRPQSNIMSNESQLIKGPVWMVKLVDDPKEKSKSEGNPNKSTAKFACHLCPAKLFKSLALQHHVSLHGSSHKYKCKYCDYSVRTQGNLTRHQSIHENESEGKGSEDSRRSNSLQRSARESFYRRIDTRSKSDDSEAQKKYDSASERVTKTKTDSQFGSLMHGSPEFVNSMPLRNGKVREKKYKCHKCPSAFKKLQQYKIHASFHGSKQKYECEKCDYSVKYLANFNQHMKQHKIYEQAMRTEKSSPLEKDKISNKSSTDEAPSGKGKNELKNSNYELTLIERQTLMLQGKKMAHEGNENVRRMFDCPYCPYMNNRSDNLGNHSQRHFRVSGTKARYQCPHCDYSANQGNFIRDHVKLHFRQKPWPKAEAFIKYDKMELWYSLDKHKEDIRVAQLEPKMLVFQDRGEEVDDRFFPPLANVNHEDEDDDKGRIYIDAEKGEPIGEDLPFFATEGGDFAMYDNIYNLVEMIEVPVDEVSMESLTKGTKAQTKAKRSRGENWECNKCPHTFEKKRQYLRHMAHHGSKEKYNCDICDYSVKFSTNYVKHMQLHQNQERSNFIMVEKNLETVEESFLKDKDPLSPECSTETENTKKTSEGDVESDAFFEAEEKLSACKYEETDEEYSSLTDEMEMYVYSGEEGPSGEDEELVKRDMELDEGVSLKS